MDDRFNTIAGWALFSGVVALGLSSLSSHYFSADKPHRPHEMGYEIEGVEVEGGEEGVPLATLLAAADPARGEAVFAKCASCHTINQGGANGIGPNLYGVMGASIGGHAPGFAYSDALTSHGGSWDFANMDAWLKSPKAFASGTKMTFAGLSKPEDRANIIVYMNNQGSNLPLPPPPAEDVVETGNDGEPGTGDTAGVGADPGDGAGPAGAETQAGPAAAGAMAQPAPKVEGGGDPN